MKKRPKVYSMQVMFAMRDSDIKELDQLVQKAGISRSEYLRILVANHILNVNGLENTK